MTLQKRATLQIALVFVVLSCAQLSLATRSLKEADLADTASNAKITGYPMFALRNPIEKIVRIYGQFLPEIIGNKTSQGQHTSFAGCMMRGHNKEELVENVKEIQELVEFDPDHITKHLLYVNYVIDCRDPGPWASSVAVRLGNGKDAGSELNITLMEGSRQGRLGVCSQSLYDDAEWLKDWVDYQFKIGADGVILHAPMGAHIGDLFNEKRDTSLQSVHRLTRRARFMGEQPLKRFEGHKIIWQEYTASPTAQFHAEELVFTACHYRLRYAYDYTIQFDIDEFWTPGAISEEKMLPDFLDKHMGANAASIGFKQVLYPMECRSRNHGEYVSKFTLHERLEREEKPAVRPIHIDRMHIHGLLEASPEYQSKDLQPGDSHWTIPSEMAFLKTIRWDLRIDNEGKKTYNRCEFGEELDPNQTGLTIE